MVDHLEKEKKKYIYIQITVKRGKSPRRSDPVWNDWFHSQTYRQADTDRTAYGTLENAIIKKYGITSSGSGLCSRSGSDGGTG